MLNDYRKTLAQIRQKVLLLAEDPGGQRFSDNDEIDAAINDAMLDLALDVQLVKETLRVQLLENQHAYELHPRALLASKRPFAYPVRVVYDVATNAAMSPLSTKIFDLAGYPLSETGGPTSWRTDIFPHGEMAFSPYPSVEGSALPLLTGNIDVTYVAFPTIMDADTEYPDTLPGQYHEAVAVGAAMLLLEGGTEEDLIISIEMEKEFEQWKAKISGDAMRGMTHYDSVRPM